MKTTFYIDPPSELEHRIISRIHRIVMIQYAILGSLSAISFIGIVAACINLYEGFMQSGFGEYISLVFSDSTIIVSYWKEILFSLVDSLPMFGTVTLLLAMAVFIWASTKTKNLQWI